ncbi:MAG: alginate export family protein, partial [Acidobacteriaceae bacterium]|nr:alginate export family protein [Acidobacteriaceae bacterium]
MKSWLAVLLSLLPFGGHAQTSAEPQPDPNAAAFGKEQSMAKPDPFMLLEQLNRHVPAWLSFGGEYRVRPEEAGGIKFTRTSDGYVLSRLRLWVNIRPATWLGLVAETQDARVFLNQHVPNAPPYQNVFDIRQAYVLIGNRDEGWVDVAAGRQVLSFGEERLVGPSDWSNQGRTFDAVRVDLHHGGSNVSLFASSVAVVRDGVIDHHNQGNDFHG